jgi:hypothetical protein
LAKEQKERSEAGMKDDRENRRGAALKGIRLLAAAGGLASLTMLTACSSSYGYGFDPLGMIGGLLLGLIQLAVVLVILFFVGRFLLNRLGGGNKVVGGFNLRGRSQAEKDVIKYFVYGRGCLQSLFRISDARFDAILKERVGQYNIFQMALSKLGLDVDQVSEINPVFTDGYALGSALMKIGEDFVFRASHYQMSCLLFSSEQVYLYSLTFSLLDKDIKEHTEEYFYRDVTSVSTNYNVENLQHITGCLGLDVRWVEFPRYNFMLAVPGDSFVCVMRPENESQVQAMTAKLREKKA